MPFTVTRVSSVMMSSPSPTNGAQDLHENLLSIGDTAFLGYQIKMNWTDLYIHTAYSLIAGKPPTFGFKDPLLHLDLLPRFKRCIATVEACLAP